MSHPSLSTHHYSIHTSPNPHHSRLNTTDCHSTRNQAIAAFDAWLKDVWGPDSRRAGPPTRVAMYVAKDGSVSDDGEAEDDGVGEKESLPTAEYMGREVAVVMRCRCGVFECEEKDEDEEGEDGEADEEGEEKEGWVMIEQTGEEEQSAMQSNSGPRSERQSAPAGNGGMNRCSSASATVAGDTDMEDVEHLTPLPGPEETLRSRAKRRRGGGSICEERYGDAEGDAGRRKVRVLQRYLVFAGVSVTIETEE